MCALASVSYLSLAIGRWDAIATLLVSSPQELAGELDRVRELPGVQSLESWTHLRVLKEDYRLRLSEEPGDARQEGATSRTIPRR